MATLAMGFSSKYQFKVYFNDLDDGENSITATEHDDGFYYVDLKNGHTTNNFTVTCQLLPVSNGD